MSDSQEQQVNSEEEENEDEDDEGSGGEQDDEEEEGSEEDEDQQNQDGDQGSDQNQDEEQENQEGEQSKDQQQQKLPKFRAIETNQFKFQSLISQIAHLGNSVDSFISTLPSRSGDYNRYVPNYRSQPIQPLPIIQPIKQQPSYRPIIMKDQDIQVSMQPQIIIQPTIKQQPKKQQYKISNQSTKFLAQLYQQNKKLKRWQPVSNNTQSSFNNRDRFQRKQYQKGIFNIDDRNKQIDQAIQMLKRQDQ